MSGGPVLEPDSGRFGLLGGGGQAQELSEYVARGSVVFRAVSREFLVAGRDDFIDLATIDTTFTSVPVVAAVGAPGARRRVVAEWQGVTFRSIVAPAAWVSRSVVIGIGSIIAPGAVITAGTVIGDHVIVNVGASIGHGCVIDDYVTISPGCRIAGRCHLRAGTFVGIGASISSGVTLAEGSVIGAGATVLEDTERNGTYVGVPARLISTREDWLHDI